MSTEINSETIGALEKNMAVIETALATKTAECEQTKKDRDAIAAERDQLAAKLSDPNVLAAWNRVIDKAASLADSYKPSA